MILWGSLCVAVAFCVLSWFRVLFGCSVGVLARVVRLLFDSRVMPLVSLFGRSFSFFDRFLLVTRGTYGLQVALVVVIPWLYVVYLCCCYLAAFAVYLACICVSLHDVAPYGGPVFWESGRSC